MPETKFRVNLRFQRFTQNLKSAQLQSKDFVLSGIGWLIAFCILIYAYQQNSDFLALLLLSVYVIFWFKFVKALHVTFSPPVEVLLVAFLFIFLFEAALLQVTNPGFTYAPLITFVGLLQTLLLAFLILCFSLILVQNSKGKRGVLITYLVLFILWVHLFSKTNDLLLVLFQLILFIFLFRRTTWLDELTKVECWIYLVLAYLLFRLVFHYNHLQALRSQDVNLPLLWTELPVYLYLLFKVYIVAVLVRIPVVLVYNHARLSRKLWISGLFQSTFPQIIQLIMLLLIFYFFIAGWQAENLRAVMQQQFEQIQRGQTPPALNYLTASRAPGETPTRIDGQTIKFKEDMPKEGIIALPPSPENESDEYFVFVTGAVPRSDSIYLVKLDTTSLDILTRGVQLLAGSHLYAYPYYPTRWEAQLFKLNFWSEDHSLEIFPFGITPQRNQNAFVVPIHSTSDIFDEIKADYDVDLKKPFQFTLGRVYTPLFDARLQEVGYFAYDIAIIPNLSFITSPILRYIGLLIVLYLLFNVFVIRRVVKFGTEINRMIVQKFNQLRAGIRQISTGNLDYKVRIEGDDEFVELANHFNQMGDRLKETIAEAREKERLEHELKIARQVQLSLLPSRLPAVPGYEIAATLKTANEVGGDFYDVIPLEKGRFLFTIGDVSGKSTSAAFYMAQCISLIRYSHQYTDKPAEIAARLNIYFSDPTVDKQMFITVIIGVIDSSKNKIRFVRAGHTQPLWVPAEEHEAVRELSADGLGIGLERAGDLFVKQLREVEVFMKNGDTIVFFTDGVVEASKEGPGAANAESVEKQFYGEERLRERLSKLHGQDARDIMQKLSDDVEAFYKGQPKVDDYTLLVVQKKDA